MSTSGNDQKVQITVADPSALGLFGLAMVTFVASTQKLGWTTGLSFVIPWAIFLGSIAQLIASYYDFKHNSAFGANVFGAYGLFWAGVAVSWMFKMGAFGPELAAAAAVDAKQLGVAFLGYFIFSVFGTIAALKTNKVIFSIMVLIDVLLACLALDTLGMGGHWAHGVAAWSELVIAAIGFYGAGANLVNKTFGKTVFPLGKPLV